MSTDPHVFDDILEICYNDSILAKGLNMQAVFYSEARNHLRGLIDKACNDFEEFIITTKDKKQAVLISYDEYSAMKETLYLLSSKNNRDRLLEAVDQIDNLEFVKKDLNI